MPLSKIVSKDIASWGSLDDIADTLEKRGLERLETEESPDNEIIMHLSDEKFLAIVKTENGKTESDYRKRMDSARHTQLVSTNDFRDFTFVTRVRSWDEHGRIKYQKFSFEKSQFEGKGERRTTLEKLNDIEYGKSETVYQLYDTKRVVKKFYDQFEEIRAKMVQEVSGIPDDRGEAKQNYAQTIFNRLIFLYFIQEKNLLDYNKQYLREKHDEIVSDEKDVYEEFYKPLFFDKLAKKTSYDMKFGSLPYLNGGLFTRSEIEEEFPEVCLGDSKEKTNELYGEILDFLGDWNWYADERLDIVEPKNLSPEVLGHIFEKTVNQKEMGAYYTPEEITHFMARNTIHPYILDRMNEKFEKEYENIDEVFKIGKDTEDKDEKDIRIGSIDDIERDEIEHLYFEVLKNIKVLDPAVGSGAFLLAAQDILLDVYLSSIEYFRRLEEKKPWEMTGRITDLLEGLEEEDEQIGEKSISKFVKREIILNNLYGVDIDKGATEICKLRLWLSMVADMEEGDNIEDVDALPNIDFNIRQGNTLIGFVDFKGLGSSKDMSEFGDKSVEKAFERRQNKVKAYKESYGKEAKKIKSNLKNMTEKYDQVLKKKLIPNFADIDVSYTKKVNPEDVFELDRNKIKKIKINLRKPISNSEKDKLYSNYKRNLTGLRANHGSGGLVSFSIKKEYLKTAPENHLRKIIEFLGLQNIKSCEVKLFVGLRKLEEIGYFNWIMEFSEIFEGGGFDVIIGNPPYLSFKSSKTSKKDIPVDIYKKIYPEINDLYQPFLKRAHNMSHENSKVSLIIPNNIVKYIEQIDEKLIDDIESFHNLGEGIFEDAPVTSVAITSFSKKNETTFKLTNYIRFSNNKKLQKLGRIEPIQVEDFNVSNQNEIVNYIEEKMIPLNDLGVKIKRGEERGKKSLYNDNDENYTSIYTAEDMNYFKLEENNRYINNEEIKKNFYENYKKIGVSISFRNRMKCSYLGKKVTLKSIICIYNLNPLDLNLELFILNSRLFDFYHHMKYSFFFEKRTNLIENIYDYPIIEIENHEKKSLSLFKVLVYEYDRKLHNILDFIIYELFFKEKFAEDDLYAEPEKKLLESIDDHLERANIKEILEDARNPFEEKYKKNRKTIAKVIQNIKNDSDIQTQIDRIKSHKWIQLIEDKRR